MFSFFGDDDKPNTSNGPGGPIVTKVKKTISGPTKPRSAVIGGMSTTYKPSSATSSSRVNGSNSSSLLKAPKPALPRLGSTSSLKSSRSSPVASTPKKRRLETKIESESDDSDSSDDALDLKMKKKRSVPSRSATVGLLDGDTREGEGKCGSWCLGEVDQRGEYGRGWVGFVSCEEAMRGEVSGWGGGERPARGMEKYVPYFPQEGFEVDALPSVELQYPAVGCREKFILLNPTSAREYSPIGELRAALRTILNHYIPPSHQGIFGTLSDSLDLDSTSAAPTPLAANESPLPQSVATTPPESGTSSPAPQGGFTETIGDALRKALAPNRRDGPAFMKALTRFNEAMVELQQDGYMKKWLEERNGTLDRKTWSEIVETVHEQAYSRVVGPYSNELEHHPKHPDEVARAISAKEDAYGELRHKFMARIVEQTGLGPDSVFVDLGSGVGNCVVQAALEAGCESYGFELLPVPAHCARLQLRETQRRWAMWGLKGNLKVEVHEGDFRVHPQVAKRLREADVLLVNNEVFPPSLNADLTNLFLDLKDGAKIVSLKPFVPESFKMNESNCDSFAAICRLSQHTYYRDWVSWKGESGVYYLQVIDRSMRIMFEEEMNGGRRRR